MLTSCTKPEEVQVPELWPEWSCENQDGRGCRCKGRGTASTLVSERVAAYLQNVGSDNNLVARAASIERVDGLAVGVIGVHLCLCDDAVHAEDHGEQRWAPHDAGGRSKSDGGRARDLRSQYYTPTVCWCGEYRLQMNEL